MIVLHHHIIVATFGQVGRVWVLRVDILCHRMWMRGDGGSAGGSALGSGFRAAAVFLDV